MKANRNDLATRFLLGELSEEERREVEERFLGDNEFFEQMLASEDALLDGYLSGTLDEKDQLRAKTLFESSSEQRQYVENTKRILALVQPDVVRDETVAVAERNDGPDSSERKSEPQESTPHSLTMPPPYLASRFSALVWSIVALAFMLLGSWSLYLAYRHRNLSAKEAAAEQSARQANETLNAEVARRDQLTEELESERRKNESLLAQLQSKGSQTTVTLEPGHLERSDKSTLPTIKVNTSLLKIRLVLDSDTKFEQYSVLITTFEGRKVQSLSLTANQVQQGMLIMTLPVDIFGSDDFRIELSGASAGGDFKHLDDYAFRLEL